MIMIFHYESLDLMISILFYILNPKIKKNNYYLHIPQTVIYNFHLLMLQ